MSSNSSILVEINDIRKEYDNGLVQALDGVSLNLQRGKIYALKGSSGCGKSTFLNIIGTLDNSTSGVIKYNGKLLKDLGAIDIFRKEFIGFIFQFHNLLPVLTLRENIETAMLFHSEYSMEKCRKRADELLEDFGLTHKQNAYANKISGGERQRGAIARAFANKPRLILADEPTGNVDSLNSKIILEKMREYVDKYEATILIATHDPIVSSYADEIITMSDGKII